MTGRLLPAGIDGISDVSPGDFIQTGAEEVTAAAIDGCAGLTSDRF